MHPRYSRSKRHRKLKPVDPEANKDPSIVLKNHRRLLTKERIRIQKLSEQHVPKKLLNLTTVPKQAKRRKPKKETRSLLKLTTNLGEGDSKGATKPVRDLPQVIQQGPYESQPIFLRRLDRMCDMLRTESAVEAKFGLSDEKFKKSEKKLQRRRERDKKRKKKKKKRQESDGE